MFATGGANGIVRIWDITLQSAAATLEIHQTELTGLCFSENGYYLATSAAKDSCIKIVDLRKSEIVKKIQLPEKTFEVRSVKFDYSGNYLGIVGSGLHICNLKTNNIFASFNEHTDIVTDVGFGVDCEYIVTTSLDRNLKVYK